MYVLFEEYIERLIILTFHLTQHLFLTNLDTQIASLEELRDNVTFAANITAARMKLREINVEEVSKLF